MHVMFVSTNQPINQSINQGSKEARKQGSFRRHDARGARGRRVPRSLGHVAGDHAPQAVPARASRARSVIVNYIYTWIHFDPFRSIQIHSAPGRGERRSEVWDDAEDHERAREHGSVFVRHTLLACLCVCGGHRVWSCDCVRTGAVWVEDWVYERRVYVSVGWSMRGRCVVDAWSMRGRCVVDAWSSGCARLLCPVLLYVLSSCMCR